MKLRYERGALFDLEEIFAYIAADNPAAAASLVARIEGVAARIAESPFMGGDAQVEVSTVSGREVGRAEVISTTSEAISGHTATVEHEVLHSRGAQRL